MLREAVSGLNLRSIGVFFLQKSFHFCQSSDRCPILTAIEDGKHAAVCRSGISRDFIHA